MKILKLPAYYAPENISSSHLTGDLEVAYINAGYEIEVYAPTPTRGVSDEVRKEYKSKKYEETFDGKIKIHRFSMSREGKNPILRAIRYFRVNFKHYRKGKKAEGIDIIVAGSTPPTQGLLCAGVKKKLSKKYGRNVPFIYNLQDIFPDSLVHTGLAKRDGLLWKIGRRIEDKTYRAADKIVVISEGFKQNIMAKGVPEEKIVIIENWIDTNEVVNIPREENKLFDKYDLPRDKFYITYSGNVGHTQNMDMLLDIAKRIAEVNGNIMFVILGAGAAKAHVSERVNAEKIENVILLPFQDYADISHVFSLGDMGLIISKKGVGSNSVPSKTWSIMSASRPVLASFDKDGDLDRVITDNDCGICVAPEDTEGFYNTILSCYENRERLAEMGKNGRTYVTTNLTKEIGTRKWVELIKSVAGEQTEKEIKETVEV